MNTTLQAIAEDCSARQEKLVAVITATEQGELRLVQHNENGAVVFITEPVDCMSVYHNLEGRMISPLAVIRAKHND